VIVTVLFEVHPLASTPVTVYVVVTVGVAVTVAPELDERVEEGDHEYVLAPEAVIDCELPETIVALLGLILIVGKALIVTVCVAEQPLLLV
jgi:hypothetical protein